MKSFFKNIPAVGTAILLLLIATTPLRVAASNNDWSALDNNAIAKYEFTHVISLYATNCTTVTTNAAAGTALYPVLKNASVTFPIGTRVQNVAVKVVTPFNGSATTTACGLSIGDGVATNIFISGAAIGTNTAAGTWYHSTGTNRVYNTATNINLSLYPVGASVDTLNAGQIDIYINAVDLNKANGQ